MLDNHLRHSVSSVQAPRNPRWFGGAAVATVCLLITSCSSPSDEADASTSPPSPSPTNEYGLPADILADGQITVASSIGHPPFEYFEEGNTTPSGFDIELMQAIGDELGVDVTFEDVRFPNIPPGLQSSRYDAAISAMRDTAERREFADFVDYVKNSYQLLVTAQNPERIASTDDLCGVTVGGVSGQTSLDYVAEFSEACVAAGNPAIDMMEFPNTSAVLLALKNGRISAYYDTTATAGYTEKTDSSFKAVGENDNEVIYGIAFPHGNEELVEAVQMALQSLMDEGAYGEIIDSYGFQALALAEATVNEGNG